MFLGLDLGTSGLRALLIDEAQIVIGVADASYDVAHPYPGWSEQDPSDWVAACEVCVAELKTAHPAEFAALRGIGISGQMHGAVCLDKAGNVLRPCILWNDTRSHHEAAELDAQPVVRELSGNIVFPGFTAPKLLWLEQHELEIFAKISKVLLPKDYLGQYLTGEYVGDMSDAAGTTWLDTGKRDWSTELLDAGHMSANQMPRLVEGSEIAGKLRADLTSEWGVADVSVVGGGGDNAAAACGTGALTEGSGFVSLGTSGVLLAARDSYAPAPASAVHTFCHAVPDRWYQMGVILAATDSLNWLARSLNQDPATLANTLGHEISGPGKPLFLPYISGERTPYNDANIRGGFARLDVANGPEALTQAVMEGVAFAFRDCLEALNSTGANLTQTLAIGGGAQSRYWVELLATVLNLPLSLPAQGEFGAALGAARLAICGVTGAAPEAVMTAPAIAETIEPRGEFSASYSDSYAAYRALYPALKDLP